MDYSLVSFEVCTVILKFFMINFTHTIFYFFSFFPELQFNIKSVFDIEKHNGYRLHKDLIDLQKWEGNNSNRVSSKLLDNVLKRAFLDIRNRPHDVCLYLCIHEIYTKRYLETKSDIDRKNAEKAIVRSIEMIDNANAIGMVGWIGFSERHVLDRALERPFETISNLASFYGLTNNWDSSISVLRSLVLRCDQHLPLYHPITIANLIDLSAALLQNNEIDLAYKFSRRARDRLKMYLCEQDEGCSMMRSVRKRSIPDSAEIRGEEYYKLVGLDHLDMLKAFVQNMDDLRTRRMMSILADHPMKFLYLCFLGDSYSVLASNLSSGCVDLNSRAKNKLLAESEEAWLMAGKYYRTALVGWTKMKLGRDHPDVISTSCSLARCLTELGRRREALRLLSSIVESAKRRLEATKSCQKDEITAFDAILSPPNQTTQSLTSNTYETWAICIWSMATYTVEESPNEEGRVRAMKLLEFGIELLENHIFEDNSSSERSHQLLAIFRTEFDEMFEGKGGGTNGASSMGQMAFVTV